MPRPSSREPAAEGQYLRLSGRSSYLSGRVAVSVMTATRLCLGYEKDL